MKFFDFRCLKCGLVIEVPVESGKELPFIQCGICFGKMERMFNASSFVIEQHTTSNPREKKEVKRHYDGSSDLERRLKQ